MRAIIVRHGNTFAPDEPARRIGARSDLPLVSSGIAQAHALASHFAATRFSRCLVSPLMRTRQTAAILAPYAAAEITEWLCEIDHGPDEGQREEDVVARIGADALAAWEQRLVPPPGWRIDAEQRTAAWRTFFASNEDDVLLVTSNGAARFAAVALGAPPARLRTGSFGEVIDGRITAWDVRPGA